MKADIDVGQAYAFATSENARTGAIFMVINNNSDQAHRLINAKSTAAEITEIHQNLIDPDDGKMMMRKIKLLDLPAGKETILEPTGYHIMLIKLTEQLEEKNKISVTLNFENYADIVVPVHIVAPGKIPKFHGDHIH
jgi:copper(I)-binding protein